MSDRTRGGIPYQELKELEELYQQAILTRPNFEYAMAGFLDEIKIQNPKQFDSVVFHAGPLKTPERVSAKIEFDYNNEPERVADIVRGTFTADTPEEIVRVQDALEQKFDVIRVKDNVFEPMNGGLRNFNNNVRMPNGHIVETQIMPKQLWDVKDLSHALMEQAQDLERTGAPKTELDAFTKQNRLMANTAVHDTGINEMMNPDWDHRLQAPFRVTVDAQAQFMETASPNALGIDYEVPTIKTKLNLPNIKGGFMVDGAIALTVGTGALVMGSTPVEAAQTSAEVVVPYYDASKHYMAGDNTAAMQSAAVETSSMAGCALGALEGAKLGTPLGPWGVGGGAVGGCIIGATAFGTMTNAQTSHILGERNGVDWNAEFQAQQSFTSDPEILALHSTQRDAEREARYAGFDQETGAKHIPGVDYSNSALSAATTIDTSVLPPNLVMLKYRLGGELPANMLPQIPTGDPKLGFDDDAQWNAATADETNESYTEISQLIERLDDPHTEMDPVEYNQGYAYLTDPNTPDAAINLLESKYPAGMHKLRNEELEQLDNKASQAVAEMDRLEWLEQQRKLELENNLAANDPDAPHAPQMMAGIR